MKKVICLLVCCFVCVSLGACTKKEDSEKTTTPKESTDVSKGAEEVPIAGTWEITEWKVDQADQFEMWGIGSAAVDFRDDGSMETRLVYSEGDESATSGTWTKDGDKLEIFVKGGGEAEGDAPFERTREFTIEELTPETLSIRAEISATDKPIVLTYRARRLPAH